MTSNTQSLVNPIGAGLVAGRTDQGVDFSGRGSLFAIGAGEITNVFNSGWPGGVFIGEKLATGKYVYYAEDINASVHVGESVSAGQLVGVATGGPSGIEIGYAAAPGTGESLAASTTGYTEGQVTAAGQEFRALLKSLGAKVLCHSEARNSAGICGQNIHL